ncbi:MAG: hypothetical protein NZ519_14000, partial [Bacteroidia bacterium]|nr:hypothetical protein [Bacteroidia bacterium]
SVSEVPKRSVVRNAPTLALARGTPKTNIIYQITLIQKRIVFFSAAENSSSICSCILIVLAIQVAILQ